MPVHPDVSCPSVRIQIAGHVFELHQPEVSRLVRRAEPAEIRDHFVEVGGRRYPVKQALAVATGLDVSDFTSQHARSALRRLGLPVGRLSAGIRAASASRDGGHPAGHAGGGLAPADGWAPGRDASDAGHPADPAAALVAYRNRWVALQRNQVLTDQDSFSDVVSWLRSNGVKADAVFLVPDNPERLLAGSSG